MNRIMVRLLAPAFFFGALVVTCASEEPLGVAAPRPHAARELRLTSVTHAASCPENMARVGDVCMDLYEAPNDKGARPFVMLSALDAEAWCTAQGKRVCTEDEWTEACEGPHHWKYPYGDTWEKGRCNDDKRWRERDEDRLNTWPSEVARREVERLWQGTPSGERAGCVGFFGVYDLVGNVEEWVRRRSPSGVFRHVLKGRFWAGDGWNCQEGVYNHADSMLYYETGTRCCL